MTNNIMFVNAIQSTYKVAIVMATIGLVFATTLTINQTLKKLKQKH